MNNTILPVCLPKYYSYDILEDLKVEIFVDGNEYQIPLDALFLMAARRNTKRGFLFVSKILGKHIPVHPLIPFIGGAALAGRYVSAIYDDKVFEKHCDFAQALLNPAVREKTWEYISQHPLPLRERTLFIGFAETATGLGHGMFRCFAENAKYIHTTREKVLGIKDALHFAEEHSHATEHYCYAMDGSLFDNEDIVVLVDDEITTGKSALNFIKAIQSKYPRQKYGVVSLLDWRSPAEKQRFADLEHELGIRIYAISLLSGSITVSGKPVVDYHEPNAQQLLSPSVKPVVERIVIEQEIGKKLEFSSCNTQGEKNFVPYLESTGRFGLSIEEQIKLDGKFQQVGLWLQQKRQGKKTLCLGTGELMYIPFRVASYMGEGVSVQSTTRSPIHPAQRAGYAVQQAISFASPEDPSIVNYVYNIPPSYYDEVFIFFEREVDGKHLQSLLHAFEPLAIPRIVCVVCVSRTVPERGLLICPPKSIGSYRPEDVIFLLKDIGGLVPEIDNQQREEAIQAGTHYSEMLPVEYQPKPEYLALFDQMLQVTAPKMALATAIVAEQIMRLKGKSVVLVSLARAGTPIGILMKRYLAKMYGMIVPHYSISIIRGKGIDENAVLYILQQHPGYTIQFVDGWTGKGAIAGQLIQACQDFNQKYGTNIEPDLAVLADPGYCVSLYGTREDFLIPSACLNSTVSGLISRTVHRSDLIGEFDFHGAKFYKEWMEQDVSELFVDTIGSHFSGVFHEAVDAAKELLCNKVLPTWAGLQSIKELQAIFSISDINMIKPGVGETTRVLLRRVPWKILVDSRNNPNLQHILLLAKDRNVQVEEFPGMSYSCCGLIQTMGGE